MDTSKKQTERIHCNICGHKTKHEIIKEHTQRGSQPYDEYCDLSWTTVYEMFECCGCEEITVRSRYYFSEWNPGDVEIHFYPPRIARRLPQWKDELPEEMVSLLEEVYTALQANSWRLAMMGTRTLIDMVMLKEVGDKGSFGNKLDALEKAGFLSKKNGEALFAAFDMGSAVSHRGYTPKAKDVQHVMDIIENLLQSTILQKVVDKIKKATPARSRKK
ncbi:MAG: DUF4145 domain-containing protein [Candidatus Hinthialibacter antarcticus]|nr:DUF4145 domain-containing protein [Candidatus Hinthialibacter antarcticus]